MKRKFYTVIMAVQLEGDMAFTDLCAGNECDTKGIGGVLFSDLIKARQYLREMAFGAISELTCRVCEGEDGEDTIDVNSLGVKVNPDNVTVIYEEDNELTFFIKEIEIEM